MPIVITRTVMFRFQIATLVTHRDMSNLLQEDNPIA